MPYIIDQLTEEASALLLETGLVQKEHIHFSAPRPGLNADLAFASFAAAKSLGKSPEVFAKEIAEKVQLKQGALLGGVEALKGYVNFRVSPQNFAKAVLTEVIERKDQYGSHQIGAGKAAIIDFSSPNIARKMHVGHLRSTVIGNAIRNLLTFVGYQTIADNHLGDWGTQFGSLLAAHSLWGWPKNISTDPIQALVEIYARFHKAASSEEELTKLADEALQHHQEAPLSLQEQAWAFSQGGQGFVKRPTLRDLARAHFLRLEQKDPTARELWRWMVEITLKEFHKTYQRLKVSFDVFQGESFYEPMLEDVIKEALQKGVAKVEPGGAVSVSFFTQKLDGKGKPVVDEEGKPVIVERYPSYLLRQSNGATLYQTRDVAACLYRWQHHKPAMNIYVVGKEQELHFKQVFETVRRMGHKEIADASVHVSFGQVTNADGQRFSMRQGNAIFLDEVLEEAVERARKVVSEKIAEGKTELTPDEVEKVSEAVGIGALIYHDLHQDPGRNIRFDWEAMLSFTGNSSPYLQFNYARCCSILRKAGGAPPQADLTLLTTDQEQEVIKKLAKFPRVVLQAASEMLPSQIAEAIYSLAGAFADFYRDCPVLTAESDIPEGERKGIREARLWLVAAVAQCLRNGLTLLGVEALEKM